MGVKKGARSALDFPDLTKNRWNNGYFVERSYPTFDGRFRRLAVPGGPSWVTYLEKEAG